MLDDLIADIEASINYIEQGKPKLLKDLGDIAVKNIKRYTPVKTGKLQNSIRATIKGDTVEVDSSVDYADDVEFGHMQEERFVPVLDRMLEPKFVKGSHMFENGMNSAVSELNKEVDKFMDNIPLFK